MGETPENPNKRYPFTLKLRLEERKRLEWEANGLPLAEHIRVRLFEEKPSDDQPSENHRIRRQNLAPVKDHALLAKLLAMLGSSHIADNLKQLAAAVKSGSLPVTPETEKFIQDACKAVIEIRDLLLKALGLRS